MGGGGAKTERGVVGGGGEVRKGKRKEPVSFSITPTDFLIASSVNN